MAVLLSAERRWVCPNCTVTDVTREAQPHTRYHSCSGLYGLSAPMVPAGVRAEVRAVEREDYIGKEEVQMAEGRPIMSIVTTRDDGQDCSVLAPVATGGARSGMEQ
jgi:hypothetical protein